MATLARHVGIAVEECGQLFNRFGSFLQGRFGQCDTMQRKRVLGNYQTSVPALATPQLFTAPSASLVGQVTVGSNCSIWYNTILRGDRGSVVIGNNVHVMDGSVLRCGILSVRDVRIGNNVIVEPNVTIEPCRIDDGAYICSGAVLMEGCHIKSGTVIGPRTVVTQFQVCEAGQYYSGHPAKQFRPLRQDEIQKFRTKLANVIELAKEHGTNTEEISKGLQERKALVLNALKEFAEHGANDPEYRPHYFHNRRFQIDSDGNVSLI
jgi:carbonic anhydrase/acetyltransferase-like protein (isoleucine patch superfamily)